jgi:hypothetical protein
MLRCILIDPVAKTVTESEYDGDNYKNIYKLLTDESNGLKVDTFDAVRIDEHNAIFVDDNGLLRVHEGGPEFYFRYGKGSPLVGRGLIIGNDDEGESVSASLPLKQVQDEITFPRLKFLGFQPIPEGTTLPGFDGASWRPVFRLADDVQLADLGHIPGRLRLPN